MYLILSCTSWSFKSLQTRVAVGSCRRALVEDTLPFAFKHSFIARLLIPALRETGKCWVLLSGGGRCFISIIVPYLHLPGSLSRQAAWHDCAHPQQLPDEDGHLSLAATSSLCLARAWGWPPAPTGAPATHANMECWVALGVPAFPSVYLWMGSHPISEKPRVPAVNLLRDNLPHKGTMSLFT